MNLDYSDNSILFFYSDNCDSCNGVKEALQSEDVKVTTIDITDKDNLDICEQFSISHVPTVVFMNKDVIVDVVIGLKKPERYKELIKHFKSIK